MTNAVAPTASPDTRLADLTARLRADNARLAERAQKLEATPPAQRAAPAPAPRRAAAPNSNVERAALAAIAAAVAPEPAAARAAAARLLWRRHGSPDRAEADAVPGSRGRAGRGPMRPRLPRPSFRRPPNARRSARRGCRSSRICRCRRRTKSGRRAARPRKSIRRRPGCRCCSAWPMSASAAATKRPSRRSRPAPPVRRWRRCRRCRSASRSARVAQQMATHEPVSEYARRPGAAGFGHPRPPRTCCAGATGRRPS